MCICNTGVMPTTAEGTQTPEERRTLALFERERIAQGLTQTQLAGRTSISQPQYNQLVNARKGKTMRYRQFLELCEALHLDPRDVVTEVAEQLRREAAESGTPAQ